MFSIHLYIHQPVIHLMNYFLHEKSEYLQIILFSAALKNKSEIFSISEFKRKPSDMY